MTERAFRMSSFTNFPFLLLHEKEVWLAMKEFHGGYSHAH